MYLITGAGGGVGSVSRAVVELLLDDGRARCGRWCIATTTAPTNCGRWAPRLSSAI